MVPDNDAPAPQRAGRPAGDRDCADFATQQQAQQYFESIGGSSTNNADRLDENHNGVACESLADDGDDQNAEATTTGDDGSTAKTSGDQVTEVPEGSAQTGGA
ncbi:excalibur calcium-binding domain-containing protein [Actinomycetospora sp. NBRC 106378]|uniref:excalibur calcium-binding domain-containing protein n=1 Tax=Actinomycetospora sp. NBRC 106378 TaxID=3032208 RepID=UPI0025556D0F|nr:excalibur calcium-binding domain-containing protein [Actinomycetospora sp. NBRC 106378]